MGVRTFLIAIGLFIGVPFVGAQEIDTGQYFAGELVGIGDASRVAKYVVSVPDPSVPDPPPTGTQGEFQPDPNVIYVVGSGWVAWLPAGTSLQGLQ